MKKLVLITFSDPKDSWINPLWEEFIRSFVKRVKRRFKILEDIEFVVNQIQLQEGSKPEKIVGALIRERRPDVIGIVVESHSSIEINKKVFFMIEMLRGDIPIEMLFFEDRAPKILREIIFDKMDGESL